MDRQHNVLNCCVCGQVGVKCNDDNNDNPFPLPLSTFLQDYFGKPENKSEDSEVASLLWPIHKSYQGIVGVGELPVKIHAHFPDVPKIRLLDQTSCLCTQCFGVIYNVLQLERQMLKMKAKIQVKIRSEAEMVSESKLFSKSNNNGNPSAPAEKSRYGRDGEIRRRKNGSDTVNDASERNRESIEVSAPISHGTRAKRKRAFAGLSREIIQAELEEESLNESKNNEDEDFGNVRKTRSTITKGHVSKIEKDVTVISAAKLKSKYKIKTRDVLMKEEKQVKVSIAEDLNQASPDNDKFFNCPKCCKYYNKTHIEQFKRHISTECCVKKPFPCEICGHIFTSHRVLSYHHQTVHQTPHPNSKTMRVKPRAEYVSEMSRIYELLQNSGTTIQVESEPLSSADNDSLPFDAILARTRKELDEDEWPSDQKSAELLGNISGTWKCWICFYESHQKSFWLSHVNRTHPSAKGKFLVCQYCEFPFTHRHHLREHLHEIHSEKSGYKCKKCDRTFLHKRSRHSCLKIVCEICDEKFETKGARKKHQLSHSEHRPYSCEQCSKTFQKQEYLALHMRTHNDTRPYQCDFCSKRFRSKSHYNNHRRLHTGEKPYICDTCGKSLSSPQSLHNHLQSHNETKKFSCSLCSKSFRTSYDVKRHQVIHSGSKPFECKICNKRFNRRGNCLAHERKHIESVNPKTVETQTQQPKEVKEPVVVVDQTCTKKPRKQSLTLRSH